MGLFDMPIIGDALGYIGGRQANDANKDIAHNANVMSQANAREQMQFQERMSNTTHAREVADLKAAGLNPILSVNAGAPAPGGASGSTQTATMENVMKGLGQSAREQANLNLALKKQKAEVELLESTKRKTDVDAKVATKGIPQADIINEVYKKARSVMKTGAKVYDNFKKDAEKSDIPNPWKKRN